MSALEIRRPVAADTPDLVDLVAELDTQAIGQPDSTPEDTADLLGELDLGNDSWVIHREGRLAGWGWALRKGGSDNVDIDVRARDDEAARWLWDLVVARAAELARAAGHEAARVDIAIYATDDATRAAAKERGFAPATSFHRMRIDHDGLARSAFMPGVTVEYGSADDETVLRTAHRIQQEGFAEHFGFTPKTFDEWADDMEASSANDWRQLMVARVHGEPAAMLLGTDHFVPDEDCGYVRTLAVRPAFRGRGLGKLLLRRAFADDERRGRKGTILHVDSGNTTPALDLYLAVGMRQVLAIDVWRRLM